MRNRLSRFHIRLGLICVVALAIRVAYVVVSTRHVVLWGDAYVYHWQAYYVLHGRGFIVPYEHFFNHRWVAAADEPPLWTLTLAGADLVGLGTFMEHKILACCIGVLTVAAIGFLGRRLGGERLGLVAAGIAALYSNLWANDGLGESESLLLLLVTLVMIAAYRCWDRPTWQRAAVLGVACAMAALTHPEMLLLAPLLGIPLLWRASGPLPRRAVLVAAVAVASILTIAPWVGRNLAQFSRPVYLSDGADITLAVTNCDTTYHGPFLGYWSQACAFKVKLPPGDESVKYIAYRHAAFHYMSTHASRLPVVVLARLGRGWNIYRPAQMTRLDVIEGRPLWVNRLGLGSFYVLVVLAVFGAIAFRRRRVPLWPLLSLVVVSSVSLATAFGNTRYRASSEVALVLLAAAGIDAILARRSRVQGAPAAETRSEPTEAALIGSGTGP